MILQSKRPAVAMIELIFAIVIMGIVLGSAPLLISTSSTSTSVALQQEGINEAASRINMILTYPWDQNNINDSCTPPVLHVSAAGDSELAEVLGTGRRIGVPSQSNSRQYVCGADGNISASTLGSDANDSNDIDDFSGTSSLTQIDSTGGGVDYLENTTVNIATAISYNSDTANYAAGTIAFAPGTAAGGSSNIKYIQVTLTSTHAASELSGKNISLNAFACNVGGFQYDQRTF